MLSIRSFSALSLVVVLLGLFAGTGASAPSTRTKPARPAAPIPDSMAADSGTARRVPELFLAWRGPYGSKRAVQNVTMRGGEGARPETLYLSFDPGRDSDKFYGMDVTLLFRVPSGDTLGTLWNFGGGTMNRRNVQIEFPADSSWGCPKPFPAAGFGAPNYRRDPQTGELQIIYAVPVEQAAAIRGGRRYCFGRVIIPAAAELDEGHGQAICVEWVKADLGFALEGDGTTVLGRPVERFTSINSPGAKVCASFRPSPGSWKPGGDPGR